MHLQADCAEHPATLLRHVEACEGGVDARQRKARATQQLRYGLVVAFLGGPDDRAPFGAGHASLAGLRARMNAPMTRPPTSRASTSASNPAAERNALASSNS
jgi:hypothetical protein